MFSDHPVVFWHDAEGEFAITVDCLQLDGVQLVHLDDTPALRVKLDIDRSTEQRWLIYSAKPEPAKARRLAIWRPRKVSADLDMLWRAMGLLV